MDHHRMVNRLEHMFRREFTGQPDERILIGQFLNLKFQSRWLRKEKCAPLATGGNGCAIAHKYGGFQNGNLLWDHGANFDIAKRDRHNELDLAGWRLPVVLLSRGGIPTTDLEP